MPTIINSSQPLERFVTGITGLDVLLSGGLFRRGMYLIGGTSGAGKTILGNQICFEYVRLGEKAIYLTLATESHGDMLMYLRSLSFFDEAPIARDLHYFSGLAALDSEGLSGLSTLIRQTLREKRPSLLVMDGLTTVENTAESPNAFRKFLQDLHTMAQANNCTVLLLSNTVGLDTAHSEYMVLDGLIELSNPLVGQRAVRHLRILKFRGSGYLEGQHIFQITQAGIVVHPRTEAVLASPTATPSASQEKLFFDSPNLDKMLGGGLLKGSVTMLLGVPGSGKTVLGFHFLGAGARKEEPSLYFGFYEMPPYLMESANQLGLDFASYISPGHLEIIWHPTLTDDIDSLAEELLVAVRRHQVKRLFIDGLVAFQEAVDYPERLKQFFTALTNELRAQGVTTLMSIELREVFGTSAEMPLVGLSTLADNVILLRSVELDAQIHHVISILKVRGVAYDLSVRELLITPEAIDVGERFAHDQATSTQRTHSRTDSVKKRNSRQRGQ